MSKEEYMQKTIEEMKALGVYKESFNKAIELYSDMLEMYDVYIEQFKADEYRVEEEYTNKAGATNMRKTPLMSAIEKLRIDIGSYSDRLKLNPKAYANHEMKNNENTSKLEMFINGKV